MRNNYTKADYDKNLLQARGVTASILQAKSFRKDDEKRYLLKRKLL